ncbi:hypothetical protein P3T23_009335 [Paraburkholderia sp. GAS448]|uniref:hypothetical protein n=1 Tax=Paraburkholderia sp. GAS448 TaxID=3035136 RepID=UPI003D1DF4D6
MRQETQGEEETGAASVSAAATSKKTPFEGRDQVRNSQRTCDIKPDGLLNDGMHYPLRRQPFTQDVSDSHVRSKISFLLPPI